MIIERDSPIYHLPQSIDLTQALYLDGIRFAIEMIDLSFTRLQETLWYLSTQQQGKNLDTAITAALHDSWSIVDSVDRLRELLKLLPGMSTADSPGLAEFIDATEDIRLLRNTVQHLHRLMPMLVSKKIPVWGVLSWFAWTNPDALEGNVMFISCWNIHAGSPIPAPDAIFKSYQVTHRHGDSNNPKKSCITYKCDGTRKCNI
jgi:hypothetical protein